MVHEVHAHYIIILFSIQGHSILIFIDNGTSSETKTITYNKYINFVTSVKIVQIKCITK